MNHACRKGQGDKTTIHMPVGYYSDIRSKHKVYADLQRFQVPAHNKHSKVIDDLYKLMNALF